MGEVIQQIGNIPAELWFVLALSVIPFSIVPILHFFCYVRDLRSQ